MPTSASEDCAVAWGRSVRKCSVPTIAAARKHAQRSSKTLLLHPRKPECKKLRAKRVLTHCRAVSQLTARIAYVRQQWHRTSA